ncbi:MAG TPA: hypothetical protein VFZ73_15475, partial [Gemmatimonadaceae bacterium]
TRKPARASSSSAPNPVMDPWYATTTSTFRACGRLTRGFALDDDERRTPMMGAVEVKWPESCCSLAENGS